MMSTTTALPPGLSNRLAAIAWRIRLLRTLRGLSLLALSLLLLGGLIVGSDYWFGLPVWLREVLFGIWLCAAASVLVKGLVVPLCRSLSPQSLAALIEEKYPELGERLTSLVDLTARSEVQHSSPELIAELIRETEARSQGLSFPRAFSARFTVCLTVLAALALLPSVLAGVLWPAPASALTRRFFTPWHSPGRLALFRFEVLPGDAFTAKGRPFALSARIVPQDDNVVLPHDCTLVLEDNPGQASQFAMLADKDSTFRLEIGSVFGSVHYHVEADGAVSASYTLTAVEPAELGVDSPTITITPPDYASKSFEEQTIHGLADLSALQHSHIQFDFQFTTPVAKASLAWVRLSNSEATSREIELTSDRRGGRCEITALENGTYKLILEEEHGIRTEFEPRKVTVQIDQPPSFLKVSIADRAWRPTSSQENRIADEVKVVLPSDVLPVEIVLSDDVGIELAQLQYCINDGSVLSESFRLNGAGDRQASSRQFFKLGAKRLKEGDRVRYRLMAADNRRVAEAGLEPQVIFHPPGDHWLQLKIARRGQPLQQAEIFAQRDEMDQQLEAIRKALVKERHGLDEVRPEARKDSALGPAQAKALEQLRSENDDAAQALQELAQVAAAIAPLQRLAEQARAIADQELNQSDEALHEAQAQKETEPRERRLQDADQLLATALQRLEALRRANDQLVHDRFDQARLEALAERQQQLADRAAGEAKKDTTQNASGQPEKQQLKDAERELSEELKMLAEQSQAVRDALDAARAEKAQELATQARELAQAQRDLAQAEQQTQAQQKKGVKKDELASAARKQQALAERARKLAQATRQPAEIAKATPFNDADAQKAADSLAGDHPEEALGLEERTARDLERLAKDLERASDRAKEPAEAAIQLARLQQALAKHLKGENGNKDSASSQAEQLNTLKREEEQIRRAADSLPVPSEDKEAKKDQEEAGQRATQAADALERQDPREAEARMAQSAQALQKLAGRLSGSRQKPTASSRDAAVEGLPNREQAKQARELARQEQELHDDLQRVMGGAFATGAKPAQNPIAELIRQEEELAQQAGVLSSKLPREQGKYSPTTKLAQQATRLAQHTAARMRTGALADAKEAGEQTATDLKQLAASLSKSAPKDDQNTDQAHRLAGRQEEINRLLSLLVDDTNAQRAQQQDKQKDLKEKTDKLDRDLKQLADEMKRSPVAEQSARRAADGGQRSRNAMQQAQDQARQGSLAQAQQAEQQAAQALDETAQDADLSGQQMKAALGLLQGSASAGKTPAEQSGQSIQQALDDMKQAQAALAQGTNQSAQAAMQRAAQELQQAAQQFGQQPTDGNQSTPATGEGAVEGIVLDPSMLGKDAKKFAGKRWGELPGELQTKVIQDMRAKYGEDYARIIKLYFEQLAETKKK